MKELTEDQHAWLADLAADRNPWDRHRRGSGGWAVCNSLFRRGLLDVVGRLTDAGREIAAGTEVAS